MPQQGVHDPPRPRRVISSITYNGPTAPRGSIQHSVGGTFVLEARLGSEAQNLRLNLGTWGGAERVVQLPGRHLSAQDLE